MSIRTKHDTKRVYYLIDYAIAEMQRKLIESTLIREAETMGFQFNVTLPKDCCKPFAKAIAAQREADEQ